MTKLEKYLQSAGININPHLLRLAERKMDQVMRTSSLIPQSLKVRSNLTTHVISMLERNSKTSSALKDSFNHTLTTAMIALHDLPEIAFEDLDYAAHVGNGVEERVQKELAEHKFIHENITPLLPTQYQDLSKHAADEWLELKTKDSLWVRLLDLVDGNIYVLENFMNPNNGQIQRLGAGKSTIIWDIESAGQHVENMAEKTAKILFELISKTQDNSELFKYFNKSMMVVYEQTGWMSLPYIQQLATETGYGA